jgi:hypothetical protein
MFPRNSRYYKIEIAKLVTPDGREVAYLRRRFVPPPGTGPLLAEHVVAQGERLDNITALYLGDPEQFWRLCDDNLAMRPDELTDERATGRRLRILTPEGG